MSNTHTNKRLITGRFLVKSRATRWGANIFDCHSCYIILKEISEPALKEKLQGCCPDLICRAIPHGLKFLYCYDPNSVIMTLELQTGDYWEIVMPSNMLVHDLRLAGRTPSGMADNNYEVNGDWTPTSHVFEWVAYYARTQNGLYNLYIMCHGMPGSLQLGGPGLTMDNINLAYKLNGLIGKITLFSCSVAGNSPISDGGAFCGRFAQMADATVIAASQVQSYYIGNRLTELLGAEGDIDFGSWEGPVYQFSSLDGSRSQIGG